MATIIEYFIFVTFYMFLINFTMKYFGGKKLMELEKEIKKEMNKKEKSTEDIKRVNKLMSEKLKISMRSQIYLLPLAIIAIWWIKYRYATVILKIGSFTLGWLKLLLIISFIVGPFTDKLASLLVEKIKSH